MGSEPNVRAPSPLYAQQVAVKLIARTDYVDYSLVQREVHSHRILIHPHVIRFKKLGVTPDRSSIYMVGVQRGKAACMLRPVWCQALWGLTGCRSSVLVPGGTRCGRGTAVAARAPDADSRKCHACSMLHMPP